MTSPGASNIYLAKLYYNLVAATGTGAAAEPVLRTAFEVSFLPVPASDSSAGHRIRQALAAREDLPTDLLSRLLSDEHAYIRQAAMANQTADTTMLLKALRREHTGSVLLAAARHRTEPQVLTYLARRRRTGKTAAELHAALLDNETLPDEVTVELVLTAHQHDARFDLRSSISPALARSSAARIALSTTVTDAELAMLLARTGGDYTPQAWNHLGSLLLASLEAEPAGTPLTVHQANDLRNLLNAPGAAPLHDRVARALWGHPNPEGHSLCFDDVRLPDDPCRAVHDLEAEQALTQARTNDPHIASDLADRCRAARVATALLENPALPAERAARLLVRWVNSPDRDVRMVQVAQQRAASDATFAPSALAQAGVRSFEAVWEVLAPAVADPVAVLSDALPAIVNPTETSWADRAGAKALTYRVIVDLIGLENVNRLPWTVLRDCLNKWPTVDAAVLALLEPLQLPHAVPLLAAVTANHRGSIGEIVAAFGAATGDLTVEAS